MRGTLHLLPATEYPTYVSALRTRTRHRSPAWLKRIGLTLSEMEGIIKGIRAALDGRTLTRDVLASVIQPRAERYLCAAGSVAGNEAQA
ncbi:MAG: hypothetical protein E6G99_00955 [Bacillati bacterium ANGP1]|uniref:Uncharacterized protein n=1 Tax=Candidatus Segetimicrobium genomatis TaxID=2569760 RepID=A0A537LQQ7_9BACT|nr:MAG: hypothetical protein E6G99_00955 [Terrabacteria group bacterium ANGP1]